MKNHESFPEKTEKERIEYYAITGGVPKYIELFYDSRDIYTAIENNVLSKSSFLYSVNGFTDGLMELSKVRKDLILITG